MPDVVKLLVESQRHNQSAIEKLWDFANRIDVEDVDPMDAFLPSPNLVTPSDVVGIRTKPAYNGAFIRITKAQWSCLAILAA